MSELNSLLDMDKRELIDEVMRLRSMLRRAMEHGLNGNRMYHALKAGDLGDEIKAHLGVS